MSAAGGVSKAVSAAVGLGCETLQLFTKNPNSWDARPLADDQVRVFRRAIGTSGLKFATAHDSYLINLAAPDDGLFQKSIDAFTEETHRAEALGLAYLVTHPGAHTGSGEEAGLARAIAALDAVRARCRGYRVRVLLETTAGQGSTIGYRFEHLRAILDGVKDASWLGVCLDTCHVFAAGYGLGTRDEFDATFAEFERAVGLSELKLLHLNDSVGGFDSRVDRHAGLGLGEIGLDAFRLLVTDPRFAALPMILETPKEDDAGTAMDPVNLGLLRGFLAGGVANRAG
jgi:deoxyribonuclease-4